MSSLLLCSAANAFELKKDKEGDVVRWTGAVKFVVDPKLDKQLKAPGAIDAIKAAVSTYALAMPNVSITVEEGDVASAVSTITVIDHEWPYDDGVFATTISKVDRTNTRLRAAHPPAPRAGHPYPEPVARGALSAT